MSDVGLNVGIDFGTHQSKICVQIQQPRSIKYEFIPLDPSDSSIDSVLFPSLVHVLPEDRFSIGPSPGGEIKSYSFFKIASAQDGNFLTFNGNGNPTYDHAQFEPFIPEQLAVLYVAGLILKVRDYIERKHLSGENSTGPSYKRNKGHQAQPKRATWRYRMGVPTEYHSTANLERKRKFEQILVLAIRLADVYNQSFWDATINEIIEKITVENSILKQKVNHTEKDGVDPDTWRTYLSTQNASVFPETAAGLIFLVRTGKLVKERYYLAMDIGGGSTDISFFKAESNGTFTYLASKSVMLAANDVILGMGHGQNFLHIRNEIAKLFANPNLASQDSYINSFHAVAGGLNEVTYRMFNGEVWSRSPQFQAKEQYRGSICYLYGGGGQLPRPESDPLAKFLLHDNGVKNLKVNIDRLYIDVESVGALNIKALNLNKDWEDYKQVLIVALGLSLSLPDDKMVSHVISKFVNTNAGQSTFNKILDYPRARWV
jgi:hypothetical protein